VARILPCARLLFPSRWIGVFLWVFAMIVPVQGLSTAHASGPTLSKLFPYLEHYLQTDPKERTHFTLDYVIRADGVSGPVPIAYQGEAGPVAIRLAADGRVIDLPDLALLKADPVLILPEQHRGKMSLSMTLVPVVPVSTRLDMGDVGRAVEQSNASIRRAAGLMSFAAPTMKGLLILMPEGAEPPSVLAADGTLAPLALDPARNGYRFETRRHKRAQALIFSVPPVRIAFLD